MEASTEGQTDAILWDRSRYLQRSNNSPQVNEARMHSTILGGCHFVDYSTLIKGFINVIARDM